MQQQRTEYTPELTTIIETLQTSLGNSLGLPDTGIYSIENEINYWQKRTAQASTKADKEAAKNFAFSLQKINDKLKYVSLEFGSLFAARCDFMCQIFPFSTTLRKLTQFQ